MFVALSLGAAVWAYLYLRQTKKPSLNAADVLPENAIAIISASDFHELSNKLTNQNLIWNELINIPEFKNIHTQINYFDSLTSEINLLKEFFENRQVLLALYETNSETSTLIAFNLKDLAQEPDFTEALQATLKSEKNTEGIFEIWNGTTKYYLKTGSGVVVLSQNVELIYRCFNAAAKKQNKDLSFKALIKNLDSDDLFNLYINHYQLNTAKTKIKTGEFILSGRSVCNIEITPDAITANGFNDCDSTSLLNQLHGQPSQNADFFQILPFSTKAYKAIAVSNYSLVKEKAKIKNLSEDYWKQANDSALFNVRKQVEENIGTKAIEVDFTIGASLQKAVIVELKDTILIIEALRYLSDSITIFQGVKNFKLRDSVSNLSDELFKDLFEIKSKRAFVYTNYLIITENREADLFYLNSLINSSSIVQNEVFMNYAKENLLVNFNYQSYRNISKDPEFLKSSFAFVTDSVLTYFKKVNDWSINITNYKDLMQFRTTLKYQQSSQTKDVPGLWTCEADTFISSKLSMFKNHKSNENEIVFQDANNNLYLVNATGNILWKKNIGEASLSDFYTVDAFKNNKYQILFNTKGFIHLIDRNGNYVPGYPLKLPANATNALSLQDYENTRDYRLIIACADKQIYNYYINATRNEKFTPIKTEYEIKTAVKYVKVGASDYLMVNDVEGKIYVYSRRGEGRIDLSNKIITNAANYFIDASNTIQSTRLYYFDDRNSLLESISLVDKKDAIKLNSDFENADYFFELIDDDKKTDIVIIDKTKVVCYDFTGNELFRYEGNDAAFTGGKYYYDADGAYFILNNSINEIQILQASQKKIIKSIKGNGVPLIYELFRDGKKYLLISENNLLKCVLLK